MGWLGLQLLERRVAFLGLWGIMLQNIVHIFATTRTHAFRSGGRWCWGAFERRPLLAVLLGTSGVHDEPTGLDPRYAVGVAVEVGDVRPCAG